MSNIETIIEALRELAETNTIRPETVKKLSLEDYELVKQLKEDDLIKEAIEFSESIEVDQKWDQIKSTLNMEQSPKMPLWKRSLKYAAVLLMLIGLAFIFKEPLAVKPIEDSVVSNAVELQLENGEVRVLDNSGNYSISGSNGRLIGTKEDDVLDYTVAQQAETTVYNKLKVPYGKTFRLVLSDGTKVHLNSGSSLRYPVNFLSGKDREVFLEGEAYFEVSKDKNRPFTVKANTMSIQVLGTQFNVCSFKEEAQDQIVLVEGSVSLSSAEDPEVKSILKPGFSGVISKKVPDSIFIEKVDVKTYTDWMSGGIVFRNSTFKEMVRKLSRSYNVVIVNNYGKLNEKKFNASFNKEMETIDDIINAISEIYPFSYSKSGNKIIINP